MPKYGFSREVVANWRVEMHDAVLEAASKAEYGGDPKPAIERALQLLDTLDIITHSKEVGRR